MARKVLDGRSVVYGRCAKCTTMVKSVWPRDIAGVGVHRSPNACPKHFRAVRNEYHEQLFAFLNERDGTDLDARRVRI